MTDKPEIKLKREIHHQSPVVSLVFDYDQELINRVKIPERTAWSHSHRFWYILAEQFRLNKIFDELSPVAWLDYSVLKESNHEIGQQITKQKSTCKIHFVNVPFACSNEKINVIVNLQKCYAQAVKDNDTAN